MPALIVLLTICLTILYPAVSNLASAQEKPALATPASQNDTKKNNAGTEVKPLPEIKPNDNAKVANEIKAKKDEKTKADLTPGNNNKTGNDKAAEKLAKEKEKADKKEELKKAEAVKKEEKRKKDEAAKKEKEEKKKKAEKEKKDRENAAKKLAKNNAEIAGFIFDDSYRVRFLHIPALKDLFLNRTFEVSIVVKDRKFLTQTDQSGFFCADLVLSSEKATALIEIKKPDSSKPGVFRVETFEVAIKKGKTALVKIYAGADSKFKLLTKEGANYKLETNLLKVKDAVRKQMKKAEKGARSVSAINGKVLLPNAGGIALVRTGFFEMPKTITAEKAPENKATLTRTGFFFETTGEKIPGKNDVKKSTNSEAAGSDENGDENVANKSKRKNRGKDLEKNAENAGNGSANEFANVKLTLNPGNKTAKADAAGNFSFKGPFVSGKYTLSATSGASGPKKEKIVCVSADDYGYMLDGVRLKLNTPPDIKLVQISGSSGEITIKYDLFDADSDECDIELDYSTDGGATFAKASAISGDVRTAAAGKNKILRWNSRADIKSGCFPNAVLKLTAFDGFEKSAPAASAKFFLNNNHAPVISSVFSSESSGEVSIKYDLTDDDGDLSKVEVFYSLDLGKTYKKTANVTGDISKVAPGKEKIVKWDSIKDCAENTKTARVRLSPNDGIDAGQSGYSLVFELKNNHWRPVISNIEIIGDSNEIKVKYDLEDKDNNLCTVEILYSADGGKNSMKPNNASGNLAGIAPGKGKTIFWYSRFDFPDNRPLVVITLTPSDSEGPGSAVSTKIFPVYNNLPPMVTNISATGASDEIILRYDLTDAEKDNSTIEIYFSIDGGNTFTRTENIKGDLTNVAPETNRIIKWSSRADITGNSPQTKIKMIPYANSSIGTIGISPPFYIKNNRGPVVYNVETAGESNEITITFDLEDPDDNESFMELYYSLDDGNNFIRTANIECREDASSLPRPGRERSLRPGTRRVMKWKSQLDFKTNQPKVKLKIMANDGFEYGTPGLSDTILIGNRHLPVISRVTAAGTSGEITIKYDLEDKENGTNSIRVWYSPANGANFVKTVHIKGDLDKMNSGRGKTIIWDSKKDFNTKHDKVIVRVTPNDGNINGIDGFTAPFAINNNSRPVISNAASSGAAGDITINYSVADAEKNNCTVEVHYSVDAGKTFVKTTNLTGDVKNIRSYLTVTHAAQDTHDANAPNTVKPAEHGVIWNAAADIAGKKDSVYVKLVPEDGVEYGEPFILPAFALDNSRLPAITAISIASVSTSDGAVKINYNLDSYKNEPASAEVYFSFDAGLTFTRTLNVSGDTASVPVGKNRKLFWNSILDTMSDHPSAVVKLIPYNAAGRGAPSKSPVFKLENAPEVLAASTGAAPEAAASPAVSTTYSARASHVALSFKNKIWIIGGWAGNPNFKSEIFSSPDGCDWASESGIAFAARHSHAGLVYKDRMWILAGFNNAAKNDVWSSSDGASWIENTQNSTESVKFTPRSAPAAAVFKNRMWVIGGFGAGYKNDVWFSYDGANWAEATSEAAFTPRTGHAAFAFNDKLYIAGGYDGVKYLNDIWSSDNGTDWQKLPANSPFEPRQCHAVLVFNKKLWLIGGAADDIKNDIWTSDNAADWRNIPFAENDAERIVPANGRAALIHNGRIYITGGYDGTSYRNDTLLLKVK